MEFGEEKVITSEKVDGLSVKLYEDGRGHAELNGKEFIAFDLRVGELKNIESLMNFAEVYAVENLDAKEIRDPAIEDAALKILKQEVADYPDGYERYFDYRDQIEPSTIAEIFHEYQSQFEDGGHSDYPNFEAFLQDQIYEKWELWSTEPELIADDFRSTHTEDEMKIVEEYLEVHNMTLDEALFDVGFAGVQFDVRDVVGSYKMNIMLTTPVEQNFDMGSIPEMFGCDGVEEIDKLLSRMSADEQNKHFDNALTYLVYQQGHDLVELTEAYYSETPSDNKFIQSVASELYEFPMYSMAELTALVQVNKDSLELLDMIAKGEGNIILLPNTMLGLYNEWQGTGSQLDIQLEKPFTIPADMERNVQIEGQKFEYVYGYTVDDTYGLVGSCWEDTMSIAEETVKSEEIAKARQADVPKAVKAIKEFADSERRQCKTTDEISLD